MLETISLVVNMVTLGVVVTVTFAGGRFVGDVRARLVNIERILFNTKGRDQ